MDRKLEGNYDKENGRILRDQRKRSSSEFVRIPIRVLKKEEYVETMCKKDTDNIESIIKKYIQKPEVCDNSVERTIPIKIQLQVNQ